jgi:hypothetical protein
MVLGGGAAIVAAIAGAPVLSLVFILAGAIVPVFYSWRLARQT